MFAAASGIGRPTGEAEAVRRTAERPEAPVDCGAAPCYAGGSLAADNKACGGAWLGAAGGLPSAPPDHLRALFSLNAMILRVLGRVCRMDVGPISVLDWDGLGPQRTQRLGAARTFQPK